MEDDDGLDCDKGIEIDWSGVYTDDDEDDGSSGEDEPIIID